MSQKPVVQPAGRRDFFRMMAVAVGGAAAGALATSPREATATPVQGARRKNVPPAAVPTVRA